MRLLWVVLFLPAAGLRWKGSLSAPSPGKDVLYWSLVGASESDSGIRAVRVTFATWGVQFSQAEQRHAEYAIRLASRSELFGCSVDGVGLLFLPAWDAFVVGRYWASTAQYETGVGQLRAFQFDMRGATNLTPAGYKTRASLFAIRLASRSELFGCLFDGFGLLFLPAAGHYSASGELMAVNSRGRYRSITASDDTDDKLCGYSVNWTGAGAIEVQTGLYRHTRHAIRLASR